MGRRAPPAIVKQHRLAAATAQRPPLPGSSPAAAAAVTARRDDVRIADAASTAVARARPRGRPPLVGCLLALGVPQQAVLHYVEGGDAVPVMSWRETDADDFDRRAKLWLTLAREAESRANADPDRWRAIAKDLSSGNYDPIREPEMLELLQQFLDKDVVQGDTDAASEG